MLQCSRCLNPFPGLDPVIDHVGMHFMCPGCGHRNDLQWVGSDSNGIMVIEKIDREPSD